MINEESHLLCQGLAAPVMSVDLFRFVGINNNCYNNSSNNNAYVSVYGAFIEA